MDPEKRLEKAINDKMEKYDTSSLVRVQGDRWVSLSNALVRAGHGLTLVEKRLVFIAISKINSAVPVKKDVVVRSRITVAEYAELAEVEIDIAYQQMRDGAKQLFNRYITFYMPSKKRNGKPIEPTEVNMRWVGKAHYLKGEGAVELDWWPETLFHLTGLRGNYASYQLKQATAIRSAHTWRLMELLSRYTSGFAFYAIEDFCVSMDATDTQKKNFARIRTQIIEPAVTELTEKQGWKISWKPIKRGRKVTGLSFNFFNPKLKPTKASESKEAAAARTKLDELRKEMAKAEAELKQAEGDSKQQTDWVDEGDFDDDVPY